MRELVNGVGRRVRRLWNYRRMEQAVRGKRGLEIGGPSSIFSPTPSNNFIPPIYALAAGIDNCNFATDTTWSHGESGKTFEYLPGAELGLQYIHDATALSSIADNTYDFVLASHILEHVADPLSALEEFHRVLKPRGAILVLVPNQIYTFDHKRPCTTLAHLKEDRAAKRDEHDQTHLQEILAMHDLSMDPSAGTPAEFHARCLRNFENRCMHHHVFSLDVMAEALTLTHFRVHYRQDRLPQHLIVLAQKS